LSSFTYRPFTLEGNFIAMDAVHEMLLQYESKDVHVFPSVPSAWADVSFERLRAAGGWVVSARRVGGRTVEVEITSEHGGELRVANPFGDRAVRWEGATMTYAPIGGNTIRRTNGTWRGVLPPGGQVRGRVR
jgi:alpha-L-fucosidase 2